LEICADFDCWRYNKSAVALLTEMSVKLNEKSGMLFGALAEQWILSENMKRGLRLRERAGY
jgi:hypothetical protein